MRAATVVLLCLLLLAAPLQAQTTRPVWEEMDLPSVRGEHVTIYYEKSLGGDAQAALASYEQFLKAREHSPIEGREADLLNDINAIIGIKDSPELFARQQKLLGMIHSILSIAPPTICFLTMPTIKSHLEHGGRLSGYTLDREQNSVSFNFGIHSGDEPLTAMVFPAADDASLPQAVEMFQKFIADGLPTVEVMMHEITEMTILERLRPRDPYYRWFSDGFANAITHHLVSKYLGDAQAQTFMAAYDTSKYADIQHEINLTYWRGLGAAVETKLPIENRIDYARYCFSLLEAKRLIDAHGIGIVAKIIDRASSDEQIDSRLLFDAVQQETGQDLRSRFAGQYQSFATVEDGKRLYEQRIIQAEAAGDDDASLGAYLRLRELAGGNDLKIELLTIFLLQRRGEIESSDELFARLRRSSQAPDNRAARQSIMEAYVEYWLVLQRLAQADETAGQVLADNPWHLPSLYARMIHEAQLGKLDAAAALADRILAIDLNPESQHVKAARQIKSRQENASAKKPAGGSSLDGFRIGL